MDDRRFVPTTGPANMGGMRDLLSDVGQSLCIGAERGVLRAEGVSTLRSDAGSTRYVYCEQGKRLAVLQVMSRDGLNGVATNVYTVAEARRRGLASRLMAQAKADFRTLVYSDDLTEDGAALLNAIDRCEQDAIGGEGEMRPRSF